MTEIQRLIALLSEIPPAVAYLLLGLGAAVENVFPPVPSDTVVVLGGVLADRGGLRPATVLAVAWVSNVLGALIIYGLARRFGPRFFREGWGRRLLRPHQFERVAQFYARHGLWAIFFSRFLPVLRVVIPTFAGFARLGFLRTAIPVAAASLLWYAVMLFLGIFLSRNLHYLFDLVGAANNWLLGIAAVLIGAIAWWYVRSWRDADGEEASRAGEEDASRAGGEEASGEAGAGRREEP